MLFAVLMSSVELIEVSTAQSRYQLNETVPYYEDFEPSGVVAVVDGDLAVQDDLLLDWEHPQWTRDGRRIAGLLVTGDLEVAGSIVNETGDFGPFLVVLGSLSAHHGVFGGSLAVAKGDATFSGLLIGHYNHGAMIFQGTTRAALIIYDDHHMEYDSPSPIWEYGTSNFGEPLSHYLAPTVPVGVSEDDETVEVLSGVPRPGESTPTVHGYVETFESLLAHIRSGQPILRDPLPVPNEESWLHALKWNAASKEYLPAEYRTEVFFLRLVSEYAYGLAAVPDDFRSDALLERALETNGTQINDVAEERLDERLYAAATRNTPLEDVFYNTPESFKRTHPEIVGQTLDALPGAVTMVPLDLLTEDRLLAAVSSLEAEEGDATSLFLYFEAAELSDTVLEAIGATSEYALLEVPDARITAEMLAAVHRRFGEVPSFILKKASAEETARFRALVGR